MKSKNTNKPLSNTSSKSRSDLDSNSNSDSYSDSISNSDSKNNSKSILKSNSNSNSEFKKESASATVSRKEELKSFSLGEANTQYHFSYDPKLLEAFDNKNPEKIAWTSFVCTEFTSLCPKTGQPDFAKIFINYIADKKMVESKSLKLYLFSFRNHGDFHEDCIQTICNDIVALIKPKFIEVLGEFTPRGGIAIFPYASHGNSDPQFKKLHQDRLFNYAPGKYSTDLSKVY